MDKHLYTLLRDVTAEAPAIRTRYDDLFDPALDTVPIPFFGDLARARVITVGLNPSDGEFRGRGWSSHIDVPTLYERLTQYFSDPRFPPHLWFETWELALHEIGVSYRDGSAAHIDICPWATRPMSFLPDQARFEALVVQSLPWFKRCVSLSGQMRLALIAGAATKQYYLNEFLAKRIVGSDIVLSGKVARGGQAFVGFHRLRVMDLECPVFFCSVSPSARTRDLLPKRVQQHRDRLIEWLR